MYVLCIYFFKFYLIDISFPIAIWVRQNYSHIIFIYLYSMMISRWYHGLIYRYQKLYLKNLCVVKMTLSKTWNNNGVHGTYINNKFFWRINTIFIYYYLNLIHIFSSYSVSYGTNNGRQRTRVCARVSSKIPRQDYKNRFFSKL